MKPIHILLAISVSIIWGFNFSITKFALETIPPIFLTSLRYSLIAFPLILFIKRDGIPWTVIIKIGLFLGIFTFTPIFIGLKLGVNAGTAALLMQAQIIFTLILTSIFLKDIPNKLVSLGVGISTLGVAYLLFHNSQTPTFAGIMFVLAASFSAGAGKVFLRKEKNYPPFKLMIWMSAVPPIPMFIISMMFETGQWESLQNMNLATGGALFYNSFISTFLGIGCSGYLLKLYSPNQVAPYTFLVTIFGFIAGYIIFGETIDQVSMVACLFILGGLILPKLYETYFIQKPVKI